MGPSAEHRSSPAEGVTAFFLPTVANSDKYEKKSCESVCKYYNFATLYYYHHHSIIICEACASFGCNLIIRAFAIRGMIVVSSLMVHFVCGGSSSQGALIRCP
mmetsp:Transcript_65603/g.150310  ORF Transcript_65603/g.150310 Transcript_65603/m.150310 type:complete len:103 (-) Transcript_65603:64-372(-)